MNQTFSSSWTFFFKYLFPAVWIPGFGLGVILAFSHPEDVANDGVRGAAPPDVGWTFLLAWPLISTFLL